MRALHPKVQRFVQMLDEACIRLRAEGRLTGNPRYDFWTEWMEEAARRTRNSDLGGVPKVLQAYGGMGSFNDMLFRDKRLECLRSEIWELGRELEREEYEAEREERGELS